MIEARKQKGKKKKHIVGLLVRDEPGLLTRISGLFSRRGFNIDTIIVGKTANPGISHIVITMIGEDDLLEQLEKQVNKVVDVIKVVDLNRQHAVVREHCLVKVSSNEKLRADIVNFSEIHKCKVLDINHDSVIIEIVGSPEKIDSFLELMRKYGIKEMSRSGVNAMQRGNIAP